jgi:hypothetical protein
VSTLLDVLDQEIARSRRAVVCTQRSAPPHGGARGAYAAGRLCGLRHARLMALYGPEWAAKAQGADALPLLVGAPPAPSLPAPYR